MKITIAASHIAYGGGLTHLNKMIEWFGRLAPDTDFTVIGVTGQEALFVAAPENFRYEFHRFPSLGLPARMFWERFILPGVIAQTECQLLFEPGSNGQSRANCPTVSLLHNIAPFSEEYISGESRYQRFRNRQLRRMALSSMRSSSAVIFLSEYCQNFFEGLVDLSKKEVAVIYHGKPERKTAVENIRSGRESEFPDDFLLYVSHIYRYKNMYETVQGYLSALERDGSLPPLLIAGETYDSDYRDRIVALTAQTRYADRVIFTGAVNNDCLQELYSKCRVFLFSSTLETCSVILIEALSHGCVMGCSKESVVPEICQDGAVYYDPYDSQAIAETILRLHQDSDLRERLSENARCRSENFSWRKAARQTLDLFGRALDGGARLADTIDDTKADDKETPVAGRELAVQTAEEK
jgi:glycosyltransferase involved in cell wall biosynthesis